jgi:hypothetical protein
MVCCYWWVIVPSGNVSMLKGFWLEGSLEFEHSSIMIALADGLCDLGEINSAESLKDCRRRAVPF